MIVGMKWSYNDYNSFNYLEFLMNEEQIDSRGSNEDVVETIGIVFGVGGVIVIIVGVGVCYWKKLLCFAGGSGY